MWAVIKKAVNSNLAVPLNELINAVGSTVNTINSTVNTIRNTTNTTNTTANTINSTVNSINSVAGRSPIRSIQRGVMAFGSTHTSTGRNRTITISAVNMSRSVLIICSPSSLMSGTYPTFAQGGPLFAENSVALTATTTITQQPSSSTGNSHNHPGFAWQVVEYN